MRIDDDEENIGINSYPSRFPHLLGGFGTQELLTKQNNLLASERGSTPKEANHLHELYPSLIDIILSMQTMKINK